METVRFRADNIFQKHALTNTPDLAILEALVNTITNQPAA
jgi:hypothetical protein